MLISLSLYVYIYNMWCKSLCTNVELYSSIVSEGKDLAFFSVEKGQKILQKRLFIKLNTVLLAT